MDIQLLEDVGLTPVQAKAYQALIQHGPSRAPQIADAIQESRSNTYKVLDRLCEYGLASRDESNAVVRYVASSPVALEHFVKQQTARAEENERKLRASLPSMVHFFFEHSEQPSIRFFQGKEGIKQVFGDMLKAGQAIYLLRSPADVAFYDEEYFAEFRKKRAKLGITTYAITPDVSSAVHDREADFANKFIRTWIAPDVYTGNVEWNIYGNKVALISYGKEAMGIIIESPQIAESFRQVFTLTAKNAARR